MVTTDPPTPAATIGSQLTLKCSADDCLDEGFAFRWMLNGQQVDSSRVTSNNNNVSQLTVDSVGTADIGTYTCWVNNAVGTTTGTFTVMEAGMLVREHCTQSWTGLLCTTCCSMMP